MRLTAAKPIKMRTKTFGWSINFTYSLISSATHPIVEFVSSHSICPTFYSSSSLEIFQPILNSAEPSCFLFYILYLFLSFMGACWVAGVVGNSGSKWLFSFSQCHSWTEIPGVQTERRKKTEMRRKRQKELKKRKSLISGTVRIHCTSFCKVFPLLASLDIHFILTHTVAILLLQFILCHAGVNSFVMIF